MPTSRRHKQIRIGLVIFWLVVIAWLFSNMQARDVDPGILVSNGNVNVSAAPGTITFTPTTDAAAALVFYPGALVDPVAYAPMARTVAEAGFKVVIRKLPYRLAPFERHQEEVVRRTVALIQGDEKHLPWIIGGHSRGGALAAAFVRNHAERVAGLLLVGTSHPREYDLSGLGIDVTKVYGSADGLASEEEVHRYATNLPEGTHWVRIEGGNHSQFGWYGWQLGAGRATITRTEQQAILVRATVDQLRRVAGMGPSIGVSPQNKHMHTGLPPLPVATVATNFTAGTLASRW